MGVVSPRGDYLDFVTVECEACEVEVRTIAPLYPIRFLEVGVSEHPPINPSVEAGSDRLPCWRILTAICGDLYCAFIEIVVWSFPITDGAVHDPAAAEVLRDRLGRWLGIVDRADAVVDANVAAIDNCGRTAAASASYVEPTVVHGHVRGRIARAAYHENQEAEQERRKRDGPHIRESTSRHGDSFTRVNAPFWRFFCFPLFA